MILLLMLPYNEAEFDNHIKNDQVVIVKFVDDEIPALQMTLVRMLISRYNVVEMQVVESKPDVAGEPFLGIFTKETTVLFYGKYKK